MTAPAVDAPVDEVSAVVDAHVSTSDGPISAPMVAALEGAWAAIRARHPEVPAVVMALGAGSIGTAGGLRLGHFAAMRWADPDQPARGPDGEQGAAVRLPEVFVGGEGLARGPADVLGTLLHEAAHALVPGLARPGFLRFQRCQQLTVISSAATQLAPARITRQLQGVRRVRRGPMRPGRPRKPGLVLDRD